MEGLCLSLIEAKAKALLLLIILFSLAGVGWHFWLTRRLAFVNFKEDTPDKKDKIRLFLPQAMVMGICMLLPIIMILSYPDLNDCMSDPAIRQFVSFPWNLLIPARGWEITLPIDMLLGGTFYWIVGLMSWFIASRRR